ncbi:hypothetical protein [Myceligenerans halotolerans]
MHVRFLGKDPASEPNGSPTLFATDRTDRATYIVQGWKVRDPEARQEVGEVPDHEDIVEVPEEVMVMWARRYQRAASH